MNELIKQLIDYYKNRTETRSASFNISIEMLKHQNDSNVNRKTRIVNDKSKIINDMALVKDKEKLLKATEKNLMKQLAEVDENTKVIIKERNDMLKKGEKTDSVGLLLYSNTVQQNISYTSTLNANIDRNRLDQESAKSDLSRLGIELKNRDTELKDVDTDIMNNLEKINDLELRKLRIEGLRILQEPYSSIKPVAPRKRFNIAIAGVTSLFFGIFMVFFLEFIKKSKKTLSDLQAKD